MAGRFYISPSQLTVKLDKQGIWRKDCYGCEVFCVKERFPCFDSSDFLHEKRFCRWLFLRENRKLHRVFYSDKQLLLSVTDDVRFLESTC